MGCSHTTAQKSKIAIFHLMARASMIAEPQVLSLQGLNAPGANKMDQNEYPNLDDLNAKQRLAVPLLAAGNTARAVAKEIGVDPQTLVAWGKLPQFHTAVQNEQRAIIAKIRGRLRALGIKAVTTIESILGDDTAPATARLKAAEMVLKAMQIIDVPLPEPEQKTAAERMMEFHDDAVLQAIQRAKAAKPDAKALQPNVQ